MNRVWPERLAASFTRARFGCKGCQRCVWPFACPVVIPSCRSLFSIASFPSATSSIIWSGPDSHPRCGELWSSLVRRPPGDHRRTLMGLIGSEMGHLAVTWSKPPAEHPVSRMTRQDVLLSLVRAPALPPRHADFGSNSTPRPTAVYASDPASPRRPQDSLPSRLLGFERTRLSLASSFQLSFPLAPRNRPRSRGWIASCRPPALRKRLRDGEMHSSTKNLTPLFPRVARPDAQLAGGFCHKETPPRRLPWEYRDSPPRGRRRSRQLTDVRRSRSRSGACL